MIGRGLHSLPTELWHQLAFLSSISTLASLSVVYPAFVPIAKETIIRRMQSFLLLFINSDRIGKFHDIMSETRTAVVGGVPSCMMVDNESLGSIYDVINPSQLDLAMPYGDYNSGTRWKTFFMSAGYETDWSAGNRDGYADIVTKLVDRSRVRYHLCSRRA